MVELNIIKHLLQYKNFVQYSSYLEIKDFPDDLRLLFTCLSSYFSCNTNDITPGDLGCLVLSCHPKDKDFYEQVFKTLEELTPNETAVVSLINSLKEKNVLQAISLAAYEVAEGKKPKESFEQLLASWNNTEALNTLDEYPFVTDDLELLLNATIKKPGFRWRLSCLNASLGSLRKGDFGFIFARPETGKTTFLASEISYFLTQTEGNILWVNNEEQGEKVMLRVYQAFFGVTLEQLYGNFQHYRKLFSNQAGSRFKLYDSAQINRKTVEAMCKKLGPSLIVFDQIDKIEGFKAEREDLLLGAKYQWGRELAKQYGPVLGVTQADGSGEGVRWLTMANVANAKTAKQAEADWILGIGAIPDGGWESIRFLNISKNKLMGDTDTDPKQRHGKLQCRISPTTARYEDFN